MLLHSRLVGMVGRGTHLLPFCSVCSLPKFLIFKMYSILTY